MQKPLADQGKEEAALLPWEAQPEWKGKRVQKHYLGRKSPAHLFSKASLGRIPFSLPVGHSSSPFSLPGEGFLKQSTNLALPPPPPQHTHPCLKFFNGSPLPTAGLGPGPLVRSFMAFLILACGLLFSHPPASPSATPYQGFLLHPYLGTCSSLHDVSFPPRPHLKAHQTEPKQPLPVQFSKLFQQGKNEWPAALSSQSTLYFPLKHLSPVL